VELQQIKRLHAHAATGAIHGPLDDGPGHARRPGHPFGEGLHGTDTRVSLSGQLTKKLADEILGRPLMVGQVEGGEAGVEQVEHTANGGGRIDGAMDATHLPHADE